jgi:hypothetical protein
MMHDEVLSELRYRERDALPVEALSAAIEQRDVMSPLLAAELARIAADPNDAMEQPEAYVDVSFALYLLAQFRESAALAPLLSLLALPEEDLDDLLGDIVIEHGPQLIASVCGGDVAAIKHLVENTLADPYARDAGLRALLLLVADDVLARDDLIEYLRSLSRRMHAKDELWPMWVLAATMLYPAELMPEIRAAFRAGRIDEEIVTLKEVEADLTESRDAVLARLREQPRHVEDAIALLQWWEENAGEPPQQPYLRDAPKIGRNDPCPCGSGMKYKKCCLLLE